MHIRWQIPVYAIGTEDFMLHPKTGSVELGGSFDGLDSQDDMVDGFYGKAGHSGILRRQLVARMEIQ